MKTWIVLFLTLIVPWNKQAVLYAGLESHNICVFKPDAFFNVQDYQGIKQPASVAAQNKFNELCRVAKTNSSMYKLYSIKNMNNAYARNNGRTKEIAYGSDFLDRIDNHGDGWSGFWVIAHELGHHIMGMGKYGSHEDELRADEFAGYILGLKKATLAQAQRAVLYIGPSYDTPSHPNMYKRAERIKKGWLKAMNGQSLGIN